MVDNILEMVLQSQEKGAGAILALGDVPPPGGVIDREEIRAVRSWLGTPDAAPLLWVHGPPGSGRTAAVAAAIRAHASGLPALRLQCHDGSSVEEVLHAAGRFFTQIGCDTLDRVLDQRSTICAKVSVLFQALRECPAVLWIDDMDALEASLIEDGRDLEPLGSLLDGPGTLRGTTARVIVVSGKAPPTPDVASVAVGPLPEDLVDTFWASFGGDRPGFPREYPRSWPRDVFAVRILARVAARLGPEAIEALTEDGGIRGNGNESRDTEPGDSEPGESKAGGSKHRDCEPIDSERRGGERGGSGGRGSERKGSEGNAADAALGRAVGALRREGRRFLEALAVLPPEPTRQALREIAAPDGIELDLRDPTRDRLLADIEGWGLIDLPREASLQVPSLVLNPRVRGYVTRRLLAEDLPRWKDLQARLGRYYLKLAARSSSVWHLLAGWRGLFKAGLHGEAYELQKSFLEEILRRGYLDVAKHILEETAETVEGAARAVVLGNLAIIYKNVGDHARALETYQEVRAAFEALGDVPNTARVLHQLGNTYYVRGDYASALSVYRRSLELSIEIGDRAVAAATRIQIANIHYQMREFDDALKQYVETIEETRALGAPGLTAAVALQISQIHSHEGRYYEAETFLREAERCAREAKDLRNLVKIQQAQGLLARKQREYDVSRSRFEEALRTAEALGDPVEACAALVFSGDLERSRLQLAESLACYLRAREYLVGNGTRGAARACDVEGIQSRVDERIQALASSIGVEAFERVLRRASQQLSGRG